MPLCGKRTASGPKAAHTRMSGPRDLGTHIYAALVESCGSRMEDQLCHNMNVTACL